MNMYIGFANIYLFFFLVFKDTKECLILLNILVTYIFLSPGKT
jgi:hypothetical protein